LNASGHADCRFRSMDMQIAEPAQLEQLDAGLQAICLRRNLRFTMLRGDDGRLLLLVGNRNAAVAYRPGPGWLLKFRKDLDRGLFG
jgi:hypothetical protein